MKKTFFVSTSIPYVNASPHIGHALEFVQADIIARYHRLVEKEVFFSSGTDDNSLKNVQVAEELGLLVKEFVDQNTLIFKALLKRLSISTDDFIQTSSDPRHLLGAQKLWSSCKAEDVYKKKYKGLYCVGCEEFKTEKDLVQGECPEHSGKKLEEVEEENYFFKLSNYQDKLLELIEKDEVKIIPTIRKNETIAFIKGGLEDFSISRSKERAKNWGVLVPEDESQIMYVWFDALSNYINVLGYGNDGEKFQKFWANGDKKVHVIGKGINRFHSIYWPAMLLSAGVALPTTLFIHGYITIGGQKMSKSLGNVISPENLLDEYGGEAVRFFCAKHLSTFEDSDVTLERIKEAYNADLANGLGNLVSRVMKMAEGAGIKSQEVSIKQYEGNEELERYEIDKAIGKIWEKISKLDSFIQMNEPYKTIKTDPEKAKKDIQYLVDELSKIGVTLTPFMPETAQKIQELAQEGKSPEKPLFLRK